MDSFLTLIWLLLESVCHDPVLLLWGVCRLSPHPQTIGDPLPEKVGLSVHRSWCVCTYMGILYVHLITSQTTQAKNLGVECKGCLVSLTSQPALGTWRREQKVWGLLVSLHTFPGEGEVTHSTARAVCQVPGSSLPALSAQGECMLVRGDQQSVKHAAYSVLKLAKCMLANEQGGRLRPGGTVLRVSEWSGKAPLIGVFKQSRGRYL